MGWTGNNTAFRTYIKGKDKASAEAHKGKDHVRTFEDASQFPSFGAALNDGFVDISFDTEELSNKFLDIADKHGWNEYLVTAINMLINFVTEVLYRRYFVFGKSIDTNKKEKKEE